MEKAPIRKHKTKHVDYSNEFYDSIKQTIFI